MATFGEWLFFDEIRESVYEESLRRIRLEEALGKALEFCNMAVAGRWDLILESEEDDDGPVEIDDPFTGDENAPEVKLPTRELPKLMRRKKKRRRKSDLAPHELRSRYDGWNPPKDEDDAPLDDDDAPESELIRTAKEMRRLVYMSRWAAMLDRRDLVKQVKKIHEDEILPLLNQNEWSTIRESDDDWMSAILGASPASPAPHPKNSPSSYIVTKDLKAAVNRLKPLLEKLGYLRDSHLPNHLTERQIADMVIEKAAIAKDETGNDPPPNVAAFGADPAEVRAMESNPAARSQYLSGFMAKFFEYFDKKSGIIDNQFAARFIDDEGRSRSGSQVLDDEVLLHQLKILQTRITRRTVKADGTVKPWINEVNAFNIEINDEDSAKHYMDALVSKMKDTFNRDTAREKIKAGGGQMPVSMNQSMAGADGETATMAGNLADPKSIDPLSYHAAEEGRKTLVNAFRQAMIELRDSKPNGPSLAVLACLWMQLDCADDGSVPDGNITSFFSAARGAASGSGQSAKNFIDKMALDQQIPGTPKQKAELGEWKLVKLIASRRAELQNMPRMDRMPPGNPPERPPSVEGKSAYASRDLLSDSDRLWYNYQKKIAYAKGNAISFLTNRMEQIMAENDPSLKPKGWRSPCKWSLFKFLKETYHDEIGKTVGIGNPDSNPITVTFFNKHKKGQKIREYSLTTQGEFVKIVQTYPAGYEGDLFKYEIPQNSNRCGTCNGAGGDCPECDGCGNTMDRIAAISLESKIKARLDLQRKNRTEKA